MTYDLTTTGQLNVTLSIGDIINCPYSGLELSVVLSPGTYKLEVWGAQGGTYSMYLGGYGGYSVGTLTLKEAIVAYLYAGELPVLNSTIGAVTPGGWNGGGNGLNRAYSDASTYGQGGGGGSDIRLNGNSLYHRVIVAGGGGGSASVSVANHGGGLEGSYDSNYATPATAIADQTAPTNNNHYTAGTFGKGASCTTLGYNYKYGSGGGGGGWYGGFAYNHYSDSYPNYRYLNSGGSGYVYTEETALNYPDCQLSADWYLTDAQTLNGGQLIPSPTSEASGIMGHAGNGYCRITVMSAVSPLSIKVGNEWKAISNIYYKVPTDVTLPEGYAAVEYIENTSTAYIDTGIKPKSSSVNTTIEIDFTPTTTSTNATIFGERNEDDTSASLAFAFLKKGTVTYRGDAFGQYATVTVASTLDRAKVSMNCSSYTIEEGGKSQTIEISGSSNATATNNLYLFAMNNAGTAAYPATMLLYSCKIYENGNLVRNYIPCQHVEIGTYFLYEAVSGSIEQSPNNITFTGGLPTTWKKADALYVKVNGEWKLSY